MPKNSDAHSARMLKVKQGFTAAKLGSGLIAQIMGVFDALSAEDAQKAALRTEFSVSTSSKMSESITGKGLGEERRQMARAILFVDDLTTLYDGDPLPTKQTDSQFEKLWRGDFAVLASDLTANAKALCKTDTQLREILATPFVAPPRPSPARVVITEDMRKLLTQTLVSQQLRGREAKAGFSPFQAQKSAWSDAKTGVVAYFAATVNSSLSNMMAVQNAAESAYTEFEGFFRAVGKENEAKIAMAKSFFGALSSYAPFPLSIVGKIGTAACGVLHTDSAIVQERALGPAKYFDTNIPTLEKFNLKLGAVKNWSADLTRLGVAGGVMPSGTSIRTAIDTARGRAVELLNKVFLDAINETYGDSPSDMANKGTEFYNKVLEGLGGERSTARPELVAQMAINKTTALTNATKSALQGVSTLAVVDASVIQPFIELQLMAEYLAALIPDENFTKAIPEPLIKRLEGAPFELILRKTKSGKGQTEAIYAAKKLPWVAGHPRHVGALVYFFRWYKKSVNPFDLATGRVTVRGLRDAMESAIFEIGTAVNSHKVTRRLKTTDTADWTAVGRDVARIRGV